MGPNFSGMRGLILVLMSNVCFLAVILIILVVTWWLLLVTWWLLVATACYWWLLLVTTRYCSFPLLVWTFKRTLNLDNCFCFTSFIKTLIWSYYFVVWLGRKMFVSRCNYIQVFYKKPGMGLSSKIFLIYGVILVLKV